MLLLTSVDKTYHCPEYIYSQWQVQDDDSWPQKTNLCVALLDMRYIVYYDSQTHAVL